jgi:hypothetical protein
MYEIAKSSEEYHEMRHAEVSTSKFSKIFQRWPKLNQTKKGLARSQTESFPQPYIRSNT